VIKIKTKPLSVNRCWQGKRYKTDDYKNYELELFYKLPSIQVPKEGKLRLELNFGLSKATDIDNPTKPFLDILQKKYNFNDNRIYELIIKKEVVKKGEEFIEFNITNPN
jgi:Holliday junction resolvase RusA-like endonuclease